MGKRLFLPLMLAAFIVSCAPALRVHYFPGARLYPPTSPQAVDLLRHEPRRPHDAFALIRYDPPRSLSRSEAEWKLRRKGAAIGADALVIQVDTVFRERVWVGPYRPYRGRRVHRTVTRERIIEAVAIHYR
ncbi:MAG: hypothetical protein JXO51_11145 [Candidatus Aminicenantes bacterium]|nr:hypothetical protein [Candidatus Aminicenantes bacterium]